MNITGYTIPRTLKLGLGVLEWIVYDQYQCPSGYWDSSTYLPNVILFCLFMARALFRPCLEILC